MKENDDKSILTNAPFGYAYYGVIFNGKGTPVDYEFLEVNIAFENLTGIKAGEIIGKTVCEVFPDIRESNFDFSTHYDDVVLNGGEKEFEQFFEPLKKWYKVQVSSPRKGYLATIFTDISFEYKLAAFAQTLLTYTSESIDHQYIIDTACEIAGAKYAVFNIFDEKGNAFSSVAFSGITSEVEMAAQKLGILIPGQKWEYQPRQAEKSNYNKIALLPSISQLTNTVIPAEMVDDLAHKFGVNPVAVVKIETQGRMLGNLTFLFAREQFLRNQSVIEALADMTGMLLDRLHLEHEANREFSKFKQITTQISDIVWRTDFQLNCIYVSPSVERLLGFSVDEYLWLAAEKRNPLQTLQMIQLVLQEELEKESQPGVDKHRTRTVEIEHYKADRSIVPMEVHISFVRDESGIPVGIQGVSRDISERKEADAALQRSMEQYHLAVEGLNDGIWDWDLLTNSLFLSPTWKAQIGYDDNEIANEFTSFETRIHPEDKPLVMNHIQRYLEGSIPDYSFEFRLQHKDSSFRWILARGKAIRNDKGKPVRMAGSHTDISERKALEEDIKQQNLLRKLLMEIAFGFINISLEDVDMAIQSALEGLANFVNADRSYTFDYDWEQEVCNNTYEWCALGVSPEIENLQKVPLHMMKDWVVAHKKGESMYIPDVFQLPYGNVRELLEPQGVKSLLAVPMSFDGNCIGFVGFDSVRQHHQYSSTDQQLLHVFAQVLANIKMRKEMIDNLVIAMRKTEESEKKLKESQTIAKLGGWEFDVNKGVFTFNDNFYALFHTNATEMGGYEMTADEYTGKFLHAEDFQFVAEEMGKALTTSNPDFSNYLEHRIRYYDGGTGYIGVKYFVIKDENGNTIKTYGVNQDITEKKLLELDLIASKEKAEESSRLKTAFLNNISHEIRTPLNGILGFGGLMMDTGLSFDVKLEFYHLLQQNINRLIQTITDIIDISELKAGTIKPRKEMVHAKHLMNSQLEKFRKSCSSKKIDLTLQIPVKYENLIVHTDEELLGKILFQLLSNAEKFTSNGSIMFGFEVIEKWVNFFVKDTGKGIATDKLDLIFEPFIQEDLSNTRGYEGNGLGLSLVKGMVELLGGEIWVESQKGFGSTFFFNIPNEREELDNKLAVEDVTETKVSTHKQMVLVAEDDEMNFLFMKALLSRMDCTCLHAYNGAEAVDLCKEHPEISIVLMDIKMPVMNGIEATKHIRKFRPELPIIATTAYAQTGDEQSFIEAGCNGYLAKPIKKENLINLLNKYLNRTH